MNYLKYTQYIYLVFAAYFIFAAIKQWNLSQEVLYADLFLAAMAVFMFFFRRKFAKKMNNNKS